MILKLLKVITFYLFYFHLFLTMPGLHRCTRTFSGCGEQGYFLLWCVGFSFQWLLSLWRLSSRCMGLGALRLGRSSRARDRPMSLALAAGFLITGPPRKSLIIILNLWILLDWKPLWMVMATSFRFFKLSFFPISTRLNTKWEVSPSRRSYWMEPQTRPATVMWGTQRYVYKAVTCHFDWRRQDSLISLWQMLRNAVSIGYLKNDFERLLSATRQHQQIYRVNIIFLGFHDI